MFTLYAAAYALVTLSLSGSPPVLSFQAHDEMSMGSLEPPPVKIVAFPGSARTPVRAMEAPPPPEVDGVPVVAEDRRIIDGVPFQLEDADVVNGQGDLLGEDQPAGDDGQRARQAQHVHARDPMPPGCFSSRTGRSVLGVHPFLLFPLVLITISCSTRSRQGWAV